MESENPRKLCGAKKRDGSLCRAPAMANGRCRIHGGKTPRGEALPQFKHGRYSKAIPTRMLNAYEAAANDPELLDLKQSVALLDARLIDLLGNLDTGETAGRWQDMRKAYRAFRAALAAHDDPGMVRAVSAMDDLISLGTSEAEAWGEIRALLDDRRKHVETQRRLELAGERGVPATEVVTMLGAILNIAQKAITNAEDRRRFVEGIQSLTLPRTEQVQ